MSGTYSGYRTNVNQGTYDTTKEVPPTTNFEGEEIVIPPWRTALVMSIEIVKVEWPYAGIVSPRSGFSRLPISINYSHLVDSGYEGPIGCQITNLSADYSLVFHKGQRFMQIMFHTVTGKLYRAYKQRDSSKYKSFTGEVPGYRIDREWLKK